MGVFSARKSRSTFGLMVLGLSLALSACGGGEGGGDKRIVTDFSACDTKPDVGASAVLPYATKTEFVKSDYFGKPYDRYDLDAVLNASSTSTTAYVQALGIRLFKVPRESMKGQCPTYFNLPAADSDMSKVWNQAAGGVSGGQLAGVFFEFCGVGGGTPACRSREMVQPTILVDEASDRWTLVHELMHYNFNQSRKAAAEIQTLSQLERDVNEASLKLEKAIEDYQSMPNRRDLQIASDALRTLIIGGKEVYVRRALEDVAIEGMLINRWASGEFQNVAANAPDSGVRYMKYSRDLFLKTLIPFEGAANELKRQAEANFWAEISADADTMKSLIENSRTETRDMIEAALADIERVRSGSDQNQLLMTQGRIGFLNVEENQLSADINEATEITEWRQHLASHDEGDLQAAVDAAASRLAKTLNR